MYSKNDGEEKQFLKPFWIPIQRNFYYYFLDMSNKNYPIFKVDFILGYSKNVMFHSIKDFMLLEDKNVDVDELRAKELENTLAQIKIDYQQRDALAYLGDIVVEKPTKSDILNEEKEVTIYRNEDNTKIIVKNTTSIIIGLLPFEMEVQLIQLKMELFRVENDFWEIEFLDNIRNLTHFIRSKGFLREWKYEINLGQGVGFAAFEKGEFVLNSTSRMILDDFYSAFQLLVFKSSN